MSRHFPLAAIFLLTISASVAPAEDGWLLTTAQFKTDSVSLKAFDASGAKVASLSGGAERTVSMEDFLDLSRSLPVAQGAGRFVLHLSGGDHLGGEPVGLKGDALVWKNADLGEISVPGSKLIAITPPGQSAPTDRQHEDVVRLSNGDTVHGIIAAMAADSITVQTASGNVPVPISAVASINFAITPGSGSAERGFRVRLDDGSSLVGSDARLDGDHLIVSLDKDGDRKIELAHVEAIEQVNGPVSWLSSRTPSEALYYRFLGGPCEPAFYADRAWGGQRRIDFKGRAIAHGIGVHALSQLSWTLDGKYQAFRTRYAIEGDPGGIADATVRIKSDGRVVYEKSHVRSGRLSPVILEDLSGIKTLTLEVDGGTAYSQDTLDWIEPALLKHRPTEPALPDPDEADPATQPSTGPATQPSADGQAPSQSEVAPIVTHLTIHPEFEVDVNVHARTAPALGRLLSAPEPASRPATGDIRAVGAKGN